MSHGLSVHHFFNSFTYENVIRVMSSFFVFRNLIQCGVKCILLKGTSLCLPDTLIFWLTKFVLGVRCSMQYPKSEASAGVKWVNRSQNGKKRT